MPRVIRRNNVQKVDTTTEGRTREDYTYIAIPKELRRAIEYALREDSGKYGYRDFSSFCKNWLGYCVERWEINNHRLIDAKNYATDQVLSGGQKFGHPFSTKNTCVCECHPAYEILKKVKSNRIKDRELIESVESLQAKEVKK